METMDKDTTVKVETETTTPVKPKAKRKAKAPKARPASELVTVPVKQMTEKEKENFIAYLQEELTVAENKITQLKMNNESAFEKVRIMENNFEAMEAYFKSRMEYIQETTKSFYKSMCLATKGDVK